MRNHLISIRMNIIKYINTIRFGKAVGKGNSCALLVKMEIKITSMKNGIKFESVLAKKYQILYNVLI